MRAVIDTNVFVSGIFFTGPPHEILRAWREDRIEIVVSEEVLDEYRRVGKALSSKHPCIDIEPMLHLVAINSTVVRPVRLDAGVCVDPDDDKFIECALGGTCKVIVSGDRHLRQVSGYRGIAVVSPRSFVDGCF